MEISILCNEFRTSDELTDNRFGPPHASLQNIVRFPDHILCGNDDSRSVTAATHITVSITGDNSAIDQLVPAEALN